TSIILRLRLFLRIENAGRQITWTTGELRKLFGQLRILPVGCLRTDTSDRRPSVTGREAMLEHIRKGLDAYEETIARGEGRPGESFEFHRKCGEGLGQPVLCERARPHGQRAGFQDLSGALGRQSVGWRARRQSGGRA